MNKRLLCVSLKSSFSCSILAFISFVFISSRLLFSLFSLARNYTSTWSLSGKQSNTTFRLSPTVIFPIYFPLLKSNLCLNNNFPCIIISTTKAQINNIAMLIQVINYLMKEKEKTNKQHNTLICDNLKLIKYVNLILQTGSKTLLKGVK